MKRQGGERERPESGRRTWRLRAVALAATLAVAYFSWLALRPGEAGHSSAPASATTSSPADTAAAQLERQNAGLRSELAVLERQLQIERASHADLGKQLKSLSDENARLRDEIALLQSVAAAGAGKDGIRLSSVRVEPVGDAGEYSYRMVLLQTGTRVKPFFGSYQLLVSVDQHGTRRGVMLPAANAKAEPPYQLEFKVQQRIEGTFRVAPDAVVRSVQVRIFESGQTQPKLMQTVTLS
jgi:hypothetical protein